MSKQLSVRLYGKPIGILEQLETGRLAFCYTSGASSPLSVAMPIREKPYDHHACEAFFGGLLPESEQTRKIIGKKFCAYF